MLSIQQVRHPDDDGGSSTNAASRPGRGRQKAAPKLQAADKEFAFVDHLLGEMVMELNAELFVVNDFVLPGGTIDGLQLVELTFGKVEAVPFHVAVFGNPADGGLAGLGADAGAIHDPF